MKGLSTSLLFTTLCSIALSGFAQEMLVDLNSNNRLGAWEDAERLHANNSRALGDTLSLPFFDDFSEPFSRLNHPHDLYPSLDLWIGNTVYVNNHMAINPPSQGVATFEGLDENGLAYGFGFSTPTLADSLTSKPIDLSTATDTVYLSFFYQAQGMGNPPEEDDLLALEYKDSSDTWFRIWDVNGYILEDYKFNQVLLPVVGEEYLHAGFQFRFINYASRAGNVDHWHLDYIELDQGRSFSDTLINDLAFLGQNFYVDENHGIQHTTASLLNEYSSMPWLHFKGTDEYRTALMTDSNFVALRNNFVDEIASERFTFRVIDVQGTQLFENTESSPVIFGSTICGSQYNECNNNSIDQLRSHLEDYILPDSPEISEDSSYFLVKSVLLDAADNVPTNDTSVYVQEFFNYYAYDDGTAELAYGLGNLENEGKVGVKYDIKKADSLQSIQIYLNPVDQDLTQEPVKLMVWSGNNEPDAIIYESPEFIFLSYSEGMNYFYNYELEDAIWLEAGTIWVGWTQQAAIGVKFSVGFDQRTDVSHKVFYNLGSTWNQSSIPGAVMIRPVFGEPFNWVSGIAEEATTALSIYPNPTTGLLHIKEEIPGQFADATIAIFDVAGREVFSTNSFQKLLDVSQLASGSYMLKVQSPSGKYFTERVVIRP